MMVIAVVQFDLCRSTSASGLLDMQTAVKENEEMQTQNHATELGSFTL